MVLVPFAQYIFTNACTAMKKVRYRNFDMNLLIHYHKILPGCVAQLITYLVNCDVKSQTHSLFVRWVNALVILRCTGLSGAISTKISCAGPCCVC